MWLAEETLPGLTSLPQFGLAATLTAILLGFGWWEVKQANERTKAAEIRAQACEKEKEALHRDLLEAYKVTTPALIKAYDMIEKSAVELEHLARERRREP